MNTKTAQSKIFDMLLGIEKQYSNWEPLQTSADKTAYALLAKIYVEGAAIDVDPLGDARYELEEGVKEALKIEGSTKWSPGGKSASELIVTYLLGVREKRSRKHNWVSVLAEAAHGNVPPVADQFITWLEGQGGIEGVLDNRADRIDRAEALTVSEIAKALTLADDAIQIAVSIPAAVGLGIIVIKRKDDSSAQVFRTVTEEAKVLKALRDLGIPEQARKSKRSEITIRKIEHQSLLALTRIVHRFVGTNKLRKGDPVRFSNAVSSLQKVPELNEKYFKKDGGGFDITAPDHLGKGGKLGVMNPKCDPLDPGRYFGGAIKGKLIPYDGFVAGDTENNKKVARAYIEAQKRPPKEKSEHQSDPAILLDDLSLVKGEEPGN